MLLKVQYQRMKRKKINLHVDQIPQKILYYLELTKLLLEHKLLNLLLQKLLHYLLRK